MDRFEPPTYVVDDDEAVCKSLARLLAAEGFHVKTFTSGRDFLEGVDPSNPACLILDLSMPDMNGLALQQALNERQSVIEIVFLTGRGTLRECAEGMKRGAVNFLVKPYAVDELLANVRLAIQTSSNRAEALRDRRSLLSRLDTLTPREAEVMHLVARGLLNKQIADLVGAAERTVKLHRARVMEKLQVHSVPELVRLVDKAGWAEGRGVGPNLSSEGLHGPLQ